MAAPTGQSIVSRTSYLLGEAVTIGDGTGDAPIVADLEQAGTSVTPYIAASDMMLALAWDAARLFCRSCWPIAGTGTYTLATGNVAPYSIPLSAFTNTSVNNGAAVTGSTLWQARDVQAVQVISGVTQTNQLQRLGEQQFRTVNPFGTVADTTIGQWCRLTDGETIAVAPGYSTGTATLTVSGFVLPPAITISGDWGAFIPDDIVITAIPAYVAWVVIMKAADDLQLGTRQDECEAMWNSALLAYHGRLDSDVRRAFFLPGPPLLGAGATAAGQQADMASAATAR